MPGAVKWGTEFLVNTTTFSNQLQPGVGALDTGRFVGVWEDRSNTPPDTTGFAVRARVLGADASHFVPEFVANTTTTAFQGAPAVTGLAGGRFAVVWEDESPGTRGARRRR